MILRDWLCDIERLVVLCDNTPPRLARDLLLFRLYIIVVVVIVVVILSYELS